MSKITASPDIAQLNPDIAEIQRFLDLFCHSVVDVVNGNLDVGNFLNGHLDLLQLRVNLVNVTFPTANTEVAVAHGLGRTPRGYIPTSLGAATSVYNSGTPWTATTIYLSATVATSADLMFF